VHARGGDDWIAGLKTVGYERAHRELTSIKGIGNKLADCICLYGLHYGEAVPIDTHLWQAACRVFFPEHQGKALTELRYRQIGSFFRAKFGDLAGWAHLYLYYENMLRRGERA
jgi:N-glycosylase/DNA lyase